MLKTRNKKDLNRKWRNFLFEFHVYGGLFIFGYLIILGISSLHYQHHFNLPEGDFNKKWEQNINVPKLEDNLAFKMAIRDSLHLFGYTPWWQDYKDDKGIHRFMITRPGKMYWVEVPQSGNLYKVSESRTSVISVMMQLHGLTGGALKGPGFILAWKFIAQILNVVFLIVLLLTLYFWYNHSFSSVKHKVFALTFASAPIIIIVFIWLVG